MQDKIPVEAGMPILSLTQRLKRLIALPSVSSVNPDWDQSNAAVIEALDGWFGDAGFHTEILAIPGHADKYNLIATLGGGGDGLVLSGHTDTVPFNASRWRSDPFKLTERDGRLHGLGVIDMKSFFALILEALRPLDGNRLRHPLIVIATADEESNMCGARALLDLHRRLGRHAIIGEPTGARPIRMHKGIGMESIRLTGKSGHSSDPSLGVNALDGMHQVIGEVIAWREELAGRLRNPAFDIPYTTVNLGHIHGGDNPNRICADCELQIDIRPLPGMTLPELRAELRQRLQQRLADSGLTLAFEPLFDGIEAVETPADSAIVRAVEAATGHRAASAAYGTEAPYLNQMGMDTVIFGPGDIDQAHQPDEYLALERITPYVTRLRALIEQFCLRD